MLFLENFNYSFRPNKDCILNKCFNEFVCLIEFPSKVKRNCVKKVEYIVKKLNDHIKNFKVVTFIIKFHKF